MSKDTISTVYGHNWAINLYPSVLYGYELSNEETVTEIDTSQNNLVLDDTSQNNLVLDDTSQNDLILDNFLTMKATGNDTLFSRQVITNIPENTQYLKNNWVWEDGHKFIYVLQTYMFEVSIWNRYSIKPQNKLPQGTYRSYSGVSENFCKEHSLTTEEFNTYADKYLANIEQMQR